MTWNSIAGAAALAMLSTAALAQSGSPQNTVETPAVTTGPAGSFSETKKEHSVDSNGVEVNKSQSFDKTQSFSSGAGTLNATTSTRSSAEVTTTVPPPPVTTTTQTTTTIQK